MKKTTFIGRLAKNIEIRQSGNTTIGTITVITDNGYKDKFGKWVDRKSTSFVTVFGNRALGLQSYIHKGHLVYIEALTNDSQGSNGTWYTNHQLETIQRLSRPLAEMQQNQPMDIYNQGYTNVNAGYTQANQDFIQAPHGLPEDYNMQGYPSEAPMPTGQAMPVDNDIPY